MLLPKFQDPDLLTTALTHRSALNENLSTSRSSNERLEFLGDAVLELIITEYLYTQFPDEQEGMLTAYRAALVKTTTLAEIALQLDLGSKLFMSKGEEATGGRVNPGLLANVVEAVIGALYLDQGITACQKFIADNILPRLAEIQDKKLYKDPKSHLQELVQGQGWIAPEYTVVSEVGPDHNREFEVVVFIQQKKAGRGKGRSKQLAQAAAAQDALEHFPLEQ